MKWWGKKIPQHVSSNGFLRKFPSGNVTELNLFASRESAAIFDQLCQTFPDENCALSSREILTEVRLRRRDQRPLTL